MRPRNLILVLTGVAIAVAATAIAVTFDFDRLVDTEEEAAPAERTTAEVAQTDLVAEQTFTGELAYAGEVSLPHRGGAADANAVVTWVPDARDTIEPGDVIYEVDGVPVVVFPGSQPAWRSLDTDSDPGEDIRQLEQALVDQGYDPDGTITVDDTYTANTAAAVERWQADVGLEVTGEAALGTFVFLPDTARVAEVSVAVGDSPADGDPVLSITGLGRDVIFGVTAAQRQDLARDSEVTVRLPDRSEKAAVVTDIAPASADDSVDDAADFVATAVLAPGELPDIDPLIVDVTLTLPVAEDALTVPASALLRLEDGSYAVEVVGTDGATALTPVDVGASAGRSVEISGPGIALGTVVIAP